MDLYSFSTLYFTIPIDQFLKLTNMEIIIFFEIIDLKIESI